jgi:hypothetical protein
VPVAHACYPSSGGRDQEDCSLKSAGQIVWTPWVCQNKVPQTCVLNDRHYCLAVQKFKIKCWAGLVPFEGVRGGLAPTSVPSQLLGFSGVPWLIASPLPSACLCVQISLPFCLFICFGGTGDWVYARQTLYHLSFTSSSLFVFCLWDRFWLHLLGLVRNSWSFCLCLPRSWDYRHTSPLLAQISLFFKDTNLVGLRPTQKTSP